MSRIAFHHLVLRIKTRTRDLINCKLFMERFLGRDDWGVSGHREMNTRIGYQVSLELSQIDIQGAVKTQRCCYGGYNLAYDPIQIGVGGSLDIQVAATDIVNGFVVDHEGTIGVVQSCMSGEDGIVRLHNSRGNLWSRVDGEFQFGFLPEIHGQPFHE